ncbi:MAG: AAA family ATPase [Planctomycetota bacterium]|nr:AAA family ATPase [Planctomycetota bacterium]
MIESIRFENFKALRTVESKLERLTVFVGPNGCGKTSVLQGLECVSKCNRGTKLVDAFSAEMSLEDVYTKSANGPLRIQCSTRRECAMLLADRNPADGCSDNLGSSNPGWFAGYSRIPARETDVNGTRSLEKDELYDYRSIRLTLNQRQMALPSYSDSLNPQIESDGAGLASAVANLKLSDMDRFQSLEAAMRRIIPTIERIGIRKSRVWRNGSMGQYQQGAEIRENFESRQYTGEQLFFDFAHAKGVPATHASEGTLNVLALLTALYSPSAPRHLLLDDLEQSLHPAAQRTFVELLREVLEEFPDLQILATAHSPYLLDCLRPDEVRVMSLNEAGDAVCDSLTNHPEFERWKDEMAPGELWSLFGERWIHQNGKITASSRAS